ncbi:MAG: patatin-like phospholipase family protein [Terracidiphilus sp.]
MSSNRTAIVLAVLLSATAAVSQQSAEQAPPPQSALPAAIPANRPAIGVALEGGGALGLAHVGVIQWFEDHHIPVDRIAGTSMGALVAALFATGHTPDEMRALAVSDAFSKVFALQTPYVDSSYRRRQDRRQTPSALTVGLAHGPALANSLFTDRGANSFLTTNLLAYNLTNLDFNSLPIPFRCVATDLNTFAAVTFASGPLPQAVRASISLPAVFPPVRAANGHYLADGGIADNLPTDVLRNELHADIVIAIRLEDAPLTPADVSSIIGVLNRTFSAGIVANVNRAVGLADVVVNVPVGKFSSTDYGKGGQLIQAGYLAAEANRAALLPYALNNQDWALYVAARASRRFAKPGILRQVRVDGGEAGAQQQVLADTKPLVGRQISPAKIINALKPVQADGVYNATYQTFAPPPAGDSAAAFRSDVDKNSNDAGILIHLSKDPAGPPYLLIGPDIAATTSNITRMEAELRLVSQNLGGYGSELRANADLGFMTVLDAEYYRLLTSSGFFVQPNVGIVREPVYIWANQTRVSERLEQNLHAGVEAGRTIGNSSQVFVSWNAMDTHWSLTTGSGGGPYISGTAQEGLLHIDIDKETSGTVSPSGFRLNLAAGALYHAVDSANAPLVMASAARTWLWRNNNIFGLTGDINSYLRANVAEPFQFTLGGPRRLSASSFDEYRGTDTYLARATYLRRLAPLPTGLGQGIYGVIGYEAGEIWSPTARAILRQDVTGGIVAATPLGSISLGGSVGDAAHRKFFLTVGRLF